MTHAYEISPTDVDLSTFEVILDVRPSPGGTSIEGAIHVSLEHLIADPSSYIPNNGTRTLTVCDVGMRSLVAARRLGDSGFTNVRSLTGGIDRWRAEGHNVAGTEGLSRAQLDRYDRQIKLPSIGPSGQSRLIKSTVTIVGAGGLGSPVASYLAGAGVGTLRLIDDDDVEISNLQRQPIYTTASAGLQKVTEAALFVEQLNPDVSVDTRHERLTNTNAADLLSGSDVVVDATDRFEARYAINDAAVSLGMPLVNGAVYRWEGQLTTVVPDTACYRCIFPTTPSSDIELDCSLTGVVGSVVGTIGTMQATEVIRILTSGNAAYAGKLVLVDEFGFTSAVAVEKRPSCQSCGEKS